MTVPDFPSVRHNRNFAALAKRCEEVPTLGMFRIADSKFLLVYAGVPRSLLYLLTCRMLTKILPRLCVSRRTTRRTHRRTLYRVGIETRTSSILLPLYL